MLREEGYKLMGAAFEVYNQLGYGMAEESYQQSLEIELSLRSIPFVSKREVAVFYKGRQLSTHYKPDLQVYGGVVAELKAVTELHTDHEAQLFNYMRISRHPVGYLINFGHKANLSGIASSSQICTTSPRNIAATRIFTNRTLNGRRKR